MPGGTHRTTPASPRSDSSEPCSPEVMARCSARLPPWRMTITSSPNTTARSRPRRLRSRREKPAARARDPVTHSATSSATATTPMSTDTGPPDSPTTAPDRIVTVVSGPTPTSAATNMPRASVHRVIGSSASRAGSSVSSVPNTSSGSSAHATATTVNATTPTSVASRPWPRSSDSTMNPPGASDAATIRPMTNPAVRPACPRRPPTMRRSFSRANRAAPGCGTDASLMRPGRGEKPVRAAVTAVRPASPGPRRRGDARPRCPGKPRAGSGRRAPPTSRPASRRGRGRSPRPSRTAVPPAP